MAKKLKAQIASKKNSKLKLQAIKLKTQNVTKLKNLILITHFLTNFKQSFAKNNLTPRQSMRCNLGCAWQSCGTECKTEKFTLSNLFYCFCYFVLHILLFLHILFFAHFFTQHFCWLYFCPCKTNHTDIHLNIEPAIVYHPALSHPNIKCAQSPYCQKKIAFRNSVYWKLHIISCTH